MVNVGHASGLPSRMESPLVSQLRFVAVASGTLALHFAVLLLLATSTSGSTSDFANRILSIEQRTGARIGVAGLDTGSGKRLDYRSEERFPMCSTFKFLAAAAVLKRVDDGQEKLDRFITYGAKDILEHATSDEGTS
jgi:beta-lactamase class A